MEHVSTDKNKNMIQNICNKNEGVSYTRCAFFFSFSMILYFSIKKYSEFQGPQLLFFGWSTNIDIYL